MLGEVRQQPLEFCECETLYWLIPSLNSQDVPGLTRADTLTRLSHCRSESGELASHRGLRDWYQHLRKRNRPSMW